jgi:hypothetical protein
MLSCVETRTGHGIAVRWPSGGRTTVEGIKNGAHGQLIYDVLLYDEAFPMDVEELVALMIESEIV